MFDLPFVMEKVHPKARPIVKSHFIHGKKRNQQDATGNQLRAEREMCGFRHNIAVDGEELFFDYGTHHTKMMVLFTGEGPTEEAQVVIHTANLIEFDWGHMTQGVWRSPRLKNTGKTTASTTTTSVGDRFGTDFLKYIKKYRNQSAKSLYEKLQNYDFSPVEAVFVASAPGSYLRESREYAQWGVAKLQREIENIGNKSTTKGDYIIAQVSSIASFAGSDTYLGPIIGNALKGKPFLSKASENDPPIKLIFPTVDNISESLNGYMSGSSIHFKHIRPADKKQLEYMTPMLCRWKALEAGRERCAPHIKTYSKVTNQGRELEWFLLTSANLSKQAWGQITKEGKNWVQSWECGVLIHPKVFHGGEDVKLIPVYKRDDGATTTTTVEKDIVCVRMPFDLPPTKYSPTDTIWSALNVYDKPDWLGITWPPGAE